MIESGSLQNLVGKTITKIEYDDSIEYLTITFDNGHYISVHAAGDAYNPGSAELEINIKREQRDES